MERPAVGLQVKDTWDEQFAGLAEQIDSVKVNRHMEASVSFLERSNGEKR
jgi:hypothetical protein